jgi:hypothetical protein
MSTLDYIRVCLFLLGPLTGSGFARQIDNPAPGSPKAVVVNHFDAVATSREISASPQQSDLNAGYLVAGGSLMGLGLMFGRLRKR